MSNSKLLSTYAIAAVAKRYAGALRPGEGPPAAYLAVHQYCAALDVALLAQPPRGAAVRLREDRVAQRVLRSIDSALRAHVPRGKTVIFTLGAPIKVSQQLIAALTTVLTHHLETGPEETDVKKTLFGNRVRFRVTRSRARWRAKVVGLVFSGDPKPGVLEDTMSLLQNTIAARAKLRMPREFVGQRWLILAAEHWIADIGTYRCLYGQLSVANEFSKILMVSRGAKVDVLSEST